MEESVQNELPALPVERAREVYRNLAVPGDALKRRRTRGLEVGLADAASALTAVPVQAEITDSLRCFCVAAQLALELAAGQRVVPTVQTGEARWRALLSRRVDAERAEHLARVMPTVCRALPVRERGSVKLRPSTIVVRDFLDHTIDALYRNGAYPGSARGWALEFAEALRGPQPAFAPRDARFQAVPDQIRAWSGESDHGGLRLAVKLELPIGAKEQFPLRLFAIPSDSSYPRVPIADAWKAGAELVLGGRAYRHPTTDALRGLARARRVCHALSGVLAGPLPRDLNLAAEDAWSFLSEGAAALRDAGFEVDLPPEFADAGQRRVRPRIRIAAAWHPDGRLDLSSLLRFHWEVALGDSVVDGQEFAALVARGSPIVRYRDGWVLLDPNEVRRLPAVMTQEGTLPATEALRAVLTGEFDGVQVVADDRLKLLMETLRSPPDALVPPGLKGTLRPYQLRGYSWLATLGSLGLGCCLADDMGLGKTIQLIAHMLARHRRRENPHLVVCPTSVLGNWSRELARFAPGLRVVRHHGITRVLSQLDQADVILTTYGVLVRDLDALKAVEWDIVALDEAQAIKNPDSQRARAACELRARHRVALSGTPMENRLDELWSLMEFLVPGLLGPRATFRRTVAVPVERFGDEDVAERLKRGVSPFLLRRLKSDPAIISDLPEKLERRDFNPLTQEQAKLYEQVVEEAMERISSAQDVERRGHVLAMLTALKQVCNHPEQYLGAGEPLAGRSGKLVRCVELLDAILDSGERALLFTQFREMGDLLQTFLEDRYGGPIPFLHGGTPAARREEMVRSFQEDHDAPPVLLVSLRAGGTGLNLTRATHVIHYDRWWNPAVEDQATDRAYRIGQKRNVQVHKLICQGTLEERIDLMLEEKRALADSVVGSGERWVAELDDEALRRLVALGDDAVMED